MLEIIPNYHPIMLHFTIALMAKSFATFVLAWLLARWEYWHRELLIVFRWCLWLCAVASIFTAIAGFHAFYTVAHDSILYQVMTTHRNWRITSFVLIELMTLWSIISYFKRKTPKVLFFYRSADYF